MGKHVYKQTRVPTRYIVNYYKWFWYCKARPRIRKALHTLVTNIKSLKIVARTGNKSKK